MIDIDELYRKTNDGLDIILYYYPNAERCIGTRKPFKIRDEDDASAYIRKFNKCYKVTDFGADNQAQSPIDICMKEESLLFYDALNLLGERYGIKSDGVTMVYEPAWEYRTASSDEKEGDIIVKESKGDLSSEDYKVFGPLYNKTFKHLEKLNWVKVESVTYIKNGKASVKKPTDIYPIYARRCYYFKDKKGSYNYYAPTGEWSQHFFYKIYEPLSKEKQYRFGYAPRDAKPPRYINGMYELYKAYAQFNEDERNSRAESDAPYDMKKFKSAFICAGERDAACLKALTNSDNKIDCFPIWFNSETFDMSGYELSCIERYADRVYNIPDIDDTGIKRGTKLAKRFWSVYTIWLPKWMLQRKDWRGNPKKDFRDFCEMNSSKAAFYKLINNATCAQLWRESYNKGKMEYSISSISTKALLELYGFGILQNEISNAEYHIQLVGNVVKKIAYGDIYRFLDNMAMDKGLKNEIKEILVNTKKISTSTLNRLNTLELNFDNYDKTSQYFFFKNRSIKVTKDGITDSKDDRYVWEQDVIDHPIKELEPMFNITYQVDDLDEITWDIEIKEKKCCYLNYIINTSRIYWREELEDRLLTRDSNYIVNYRLNHKFNIAGPLLGEDEIKEQKHNLVNKIFTIGYLLHRYRGDSIAWAPFLMDGKVGEDGECNGRSGKSFFLKALTNLLSTKRIDGRGSIKDEKFLFDGVTDSTDMVYIDDADRDFPIKRFYSLITSDFFVNPKGETPFAIPFDRAPKMAFTTNYIPYDFDSSTVARLLFVVFSDYYHERTMTNGYMQSRSIRDDFDKELMRDYTEEEWNLDYNFMLQCLQFYLQIMDKLAIKIQPPMDNILKRKYDQDMGGEAFKEWAYNFFYEGGPNLDRTLIASDVAKEFEESVNFSIRWTPQRFNKALQAFFKTCPYIYECNPKDLAQANGRIQVTDIHGSRKTGLHVRSLAEHNRMMSEQEQVEESKEDDKYEF